MTLVRGSNPIWFEVDLTAHAFDDTFYLFVLTNTIPYIPLIVWQDPFGNVDWTSPIRFLANGTLPNNIYYDPDVVYRLEFRQGPTQNDPLIYLVENYVPGSGTNPTPGEEALITDNQISNPQFALINFVSPLTLNAISSQIIQVAPDWFLHLTGTGNVTLTQVLINSTVTQNPTNASYALQIQLSGSWTNAFLSQRFHQNGVLWSNTNVSSVIMALSTESDTISSILVDSQGHLLADIMADTVLTENFVAYPGQGAISASSDTDFPPTAYIEYQISIPNNCNITLSSMQLIASDLLLDFPYEQNTIERQIDQTFHYFKPQLEYKPIPSYLVAWDFPLNPSQFFANGSTMLGATGANKSSYVWDQTIAFQTVDNVLSVARQSANKGLNVTVSDNSSFALIQYIPLEIAREILAQRNAIQLKGQVSAGSLGGTVSLWWTNDVTLPDIKSANYNSLVSLINSGVPTCANGTWFQVNNPNAPSSAAPFTLTTTDTVFNFNGFKDILTGSSDATFMAIVVCFNTMLSTTTMTLEYCSLNGGDIATRPAPQTKDEVLRECQYYFEQSYIDPADVGTAIDAGGHECPMSAVNVQGSANSFSYPAPFDVQFSVPKIHTPTLIFYSTSGLIDNVNSKLFYPLTATLAFTTDNVDQPLTSFWVSILSSKSLIFLPKVITPLNSIADSSTTNHFVSSGISFQYRADSRLGTY